MNEQLKIFEYFPLLVPVDETWTKYDGYITVKETDYRLTLDVPEYPKATNSKITFSNKLLAYFQLLVTVETENVDLIDYLKNIHNIISENYEAPSRQHIDYKVLYNVLRQYDDLCKDKTVRTVDMSTDFTTLNVKYLDEANAEHFLVIKINLMSSDKNTFEVISHNLPQLKQNDGFIKPSNKIETIWKKFCALVDSLQPFYHAMDSVDTVCWVLDPKKPLKTDTYRRIVIDNNVSLNITFNPWNMNEKPQMQFLGPDRLIQPFREKLASNFNNWNPECDVIYNILNLLELPFFPIKPSEDKISTEIVLHNDEECGICFALRLNDKLPDVICSKILCEIHYHSECLYQWFLALTTTIRAYNVVRGECPNCKSLISCSVPK